MCMREFNLSNFVVRFLLDCLASNLDKIVKSLKKVNYDKGLLLCLTFNKLNFKRPLLVCVNFCVVYIKAQL